MQERGVELAIWQKTKRAVLRPALTCIRCARGKAHARNDGRWELAADFFFFRRTKAIGIDVVATHCTAAAIVADAFIPIGVRGESHFDANAR